VGRLLVISLRCPPSRWWSLRCCCCCTRPVRPTRAGLPPSSP